MKNKETILLGLLFFLVIGCKNEFTIQRQNQESDKREGEKVMNAYFDNLFLNKEKQNLIFYSQAYLDVSSKEEITKQNQFIESKLGKVTGKEIKHWETSVVTGTSPKSEYAFVYDVQREKHNSTETFYLIKESTDSIKIYSYKIDSKGLLMNE